MSMPLNLNRLHRPSDPGHASDPLTSRGRLGSQVDPLVLHRDEPIFVDLVREFGYTPAGHPRTGSSPLVAEQMLGEIDRTEAAAAVADLVAAVEGSAVSS